MSYATDHVSALADVATAGASVTFTFVSPGTYDETTDTYSGGSSSTVTGSAIRVRGDRREYEALKLVQSEAPTLFFTPTTYGQVPAIGASVTWNSVVYIVRSVDPVSPDGTAICARVIVAR